MPGKGPGPLPGEKTAAPDGAVPAEAAAAVRRWYVRDTELDLPTAAAAARAGSQASLMLLSPDTPSPAADGEAAAAAQAAEQGSKAATKGRKQHNNDPAAAPTHDVFRLQPIWRPSLAATAAAAGSSAAAAADGPPVVRQGSRKQLMHAAAQWRADEKLMRPLLQSRLVVAAPGAAAAAAGEPSGRYGISTLHKEIEAGILQPLEFNGGGGGGGGGDSNGTRPTSPLSVASDNSVFLSVPSSDRATSPNGRGAAPPRRPTASVLSLASSRARSPPPEQDPTATVLVVHRHFENAPDTAAAAAASADSPAARFIEAQNPALLDELLNQDLLLALPEPRILRYNLPWDADKGFSLAREEHKNYIDSLGRTLFSQLKQAVHAAADVEDPLDSDATLREAAFHLSYFRHEASFAYGRQDVVEKIVQFAMSKGPETPAPLATTSATMSSRASIVPLRKGSQHHMGMGGGNSESTLTTPQRLAESTTTPLSPAAASTTAGTSVATALPLIVHAPPGGGKSATLAQAVAALAPYIRSANAVVVARSVGLTYGSNNSRLFLLSLCRQLSRCYGTEEARVPSDMAGVMAMFHECLAYSSAAKPLVLVLDSVGGFGSGSSSKACEAMAWLPVRLPPHTRLIMSVSSDQRLYSIFRSRYTGHEASVFLELPPMRSEDMVPILQRRLERFQLLNRPRLNLLRKAFDKVRQPAYLALMAEELQLTEHAEKEDQYFARPLPTSVPALLDTIFARLERLIQPSLVVRRAFAYLSCNPYGGLSFTELSELLAADKDLQSANIPGAIRQDVAVKRGAAVASSGGSSAAAAPSASTTTVNWVPPLLLERLLQNASHLLLKHAVSDLWAYRWRSTSIAAHARERYLPTPEDYRAVHSALADYFAGEHPLVEQPPIMRMTYLSQRQASQISAEDGGGTNTRSGTTSEGTTPYRFNTRHFHSLPYHMLQAGRGHDFALGYLCRVDWLFAKLAAMGIEELLIDFEKTEQQPDLPDPLSLRLIRQTINLAYLSGPLARDPLQLPAQLLGRLYPYIGDEDLPYIQALVASAKEAWHSSSIRTAFADTSSLLPHLGWMCLPTTGNPLESSMPASESGLTCIATSADGALTVSGSIDGLATVWNMKTTEAEAWFQHEQAISSLAFVPGHRTVLVGLLDGTVAAWNITTHAHTGSLAAHAGEVSCMAVAADASVMATGSIDATVRVRRLGKSGAADDDAMVLYRANTVCKTDGPRVLSVAFSPTADRVVAGCHQGSVVIWDAKNGKKLQTLAAAAAPSPVYSVAVTPDSQHLLAATESGLFVRFSLETGEKLACFDELAEWVLCVAIAPDASFAMAGLPDGAMRAFSMDSGEILAEFTGEAHVECVAVCLEGMYVVTGTKDRTVQKWNLQQGAPSGPFKGHPQTVLRVAVSPDGARAASCSVDCPDYFAIWDIDSGNAVASSSRHGGDVTAVEMPPNSALAVGASATTVKTWEVATGKTAVQIKDLPSPALCLASMPDGKMVLVGCESGELLVCNMEEGKIVRQFKAHEQAVVAVGLTPDGKLACSTTGKGTKLWVLEEQLCSATLAGRATDVLFSDNQEFVVVAEGGGSLRRYDVNSVLKKGAFADTAPMLLGGHPDEVMQMALCNDGRFLASASRNKVVVHDLFTGTQQAALDLSNDMTGGVIGLAASMNPECIRLAIGCRSGMVSVLEVQAPSSRLHRHRGGSTFIRTASQNPGDMLDIDAHFFFASEAGMDILVGDVTKEVVTPHERTTRVFVSALPADTETERQLLFTNVYADVRRYAQAHGIEFELFARCGAELDDDPTDSFCLQLIERVRQRSTGLCFVAFVGDRYSNDGAFVVPPLLLPDQFAALTAVENKQGCCVLL